MTTDFPLHVIIQTGRGTQPTKMRGDPGKFHKENCQHIKNGKHYSKIVSIHKACEDGWEPCKSCFKFEEKNINEELKNQTTKELLQKIKSTPSGTWEVTTRLEPKRSKAVIEVTRRRANGKCEMPECTAPLFFTDQGAPYIEVHHLKPLSQYGPDLPTNTAALCPSCHRRLHYGRDRDDCRQKLLEYVTKAQSEFEIRSNIE